MMAIYFSGTGHMCAAVGLAQDARWLNSLVIAFLVGGVEGCRARAAAMPAE